MFSSAQVDQLRGFVAKAFDLTCTILRQTSSQNSGGSTTTATTQTPNVACHVRPNRRIPQEQAEAGTLSALKRFEVILPYDQTISVQDQIAVNSGGSTTVTAGANSAVQTLASVADVVVGGGLYFGTAAVWAQVLGISGSTVTLGEAVNTATGEVVTSTVTYKVLADDSGKSYQTKIICDCMKVDDGNA